MSSYHHHRRSEFNFWDKGALLCVRAPYVTVLTKNISVMTVYCDRCDRYFPHYGALAQHEAGVERTLALRRLRDRLHDHCDEHFDDGGELAEHMDDAHFYCSSCERVFKNEQGLHEHCRQSSVHHYCTPCRRLFTSANNLNAHMNSALHKPRTITCPGRGCGQSFINGPSLAAHLEAGSCASGANRQSLNRYIRAQDTRNVITDPARLIAAAESDNTRYVATGRSWNGTAYECYLCHGKFRTLPGLNQHLASPRHEEQTYICRGPGCSRRFQTLSALWAHVDSEQCGVARFGAVKRAMDELSDRLQRTRIAN
ncbi:Zinc finger protein [Mycena indigotica]|uniref:Zinc finger protein n=1 Tax=Mycena indigotica TaxID=2126181 RepID=A0A8H6WCS1_9AGAR|nr:Zinc finger protein [Mycena indigotica]KAF7311716.1 Zinc finger protein [Mycena indigotica]